MSGPSYEDMEEVASDTVSEIDTFSLHFVHFKDASGKICFGIIVDGRIHSEPQLSEIIELCLRATVDFRLAVERTTTRRPS